MGKFDFTRRTNTAQIEIDIHKNFVARVLIHTLKVSIKNQNVGRISSYREYSSALQIVNEIDFVISALSNLGALDMRNHIDSLRRLKKLILQPTWITPEEFAMNVGYGKDYSNGVHVVVKRRLELRTTTTITKRYVEQLTYHGGKVTVG